VEKTRKKEHPMSITHVSTLRPLSMALIAATIAGCGAGPQDSSEDPNPQATQATPLSAAAIDETKLVTLTGNTHPSANATYDAGIVDDALVLEHMQLVLRRSPEREAALTAHIDALHDQGSPLYHQWLTAQDFADRYGVPEADVAVVTSWLEKHGFNVDSVPTSRMFVEFTGTAGQVREAFHTEIHNLEVKGKRHIANMSDPKIPAALAPVVVGVHALHDFFPHPMHADRGAVRRDAATGTWSMDSADPSFTINDGTSSLYAVAPADFATIYDLSPLFSAGTRGAGQTVAVIEDTDIENASDVTNFRSAFGLSGYAGTFKQVQPTGSTTCSNPGVNSHEGEAALDAEWAGAAAPDAAIELASCADTSTVFGGLIAVQDLVNGASPPPIISISYGECEAENGSAANQSYVSAYQQAAAEGVSVFVSAGDAGAADCDAGDAYATHGIAVSGFASTPYNVAVGGTDFMDTYDSLHGGPALGTYWNATNTSTDASARSYIPEIPWNDACTSKLIYTTEGFTSAYGSAGFCSSATGKASFLTTAAGSGGPSAYSAQPSWQTGVVGLPTASGGKRYLPDVSLFAGNGVWSHFYVYYMSDTAEKGVSGAFLAAGGTSFAAPALAGIQALVNQKTASKQGNPSATYYKLAASEYGTSGNASCNSAGGTAAAPVLPASSCIFNDVTQGDIDVPCAGATGCYGSSTSGSTTYYGELSTSTSSVSPAYAAGVGWDYATGLGTVNAENLVANWPGPCNVCQPGAELCLAPLAPVASLAAGACKSVLAACNPSTPPTCGPVGTFAAGGVYGIAFDGTNMWVTNFTSGTVTKLSATGATLGTFTVGGSPYGIAFDGTNMWVTNANSNTVSKLSATGATLGTFTVGGGPHGIAFDGTNMWIANIASNTVNKLSPTGATLGTFAVGLAPFRIAFDGANMWVTNTNSNTVSKLSLTGATLGTFAVGSAPYGIAFDGTNMWIANTGSNTVSKLSPTGATLGTFAMGAPERIAFDGTNMWITTGSNTVTKLSPTGATLGTFAGSESWEIAFDGLHMWVANGSNVTEL
jgi:subtilase family serine protease